MSRLRKIADQVLDAMSKHPKKMPLNDKGQLVPDPVPMAPPIGYRATPSMIEIVRQQVLAVSRDAAMQGMETEEEADDFDVGDDPELRSPYEIDEETETPIRVLKARAEQAELDYIEAKREAGLRMQDDAKFARKPKGGEKTSQEGKKSSDGDREARSDD